MICSLIDLGNAENKEIKREIFTVIRCLHCTQFSPRGGEKKRRVFELAAYQVIHLANCDKSK